jgi:hypothetical protein
MILVVKHIRSRCACQAKRSLNRSVRYPQRSVSGRSPPRSLDCGPLEYVVRLLVDTDEMEAVSIRSCPLQRAGCPDIAAGLDGRGNFQSLGIYLPDFAWDNQIYAAAGEPKRGGGGCEIVAAGARDLQSA